MLDLFQDIFLLDLIGYRDPFLTIFVEASDPDDACCALIHLIISSILSKGDSMKNRILCRNVRRKIRIDRIQSL